MTRWPAICSGDSLAISVDCAVSAASCAAVGTAAGPWIASAPCCAEVPGSGGVCAPLAGCEDWPAGDWPADDGPADGWLLATELPAGWAGEPAPAAGTDEPQPAVSATAAAAATPPAVRQSR